MKLESLALHHGYESEETTKSAAVPIYQTTSYTFDNTQHGADLFDLKVPGNIYTRIMNPTTAVLEQRIAEMEGGIGALGVASGMSAITYSIQCLTRAGDNIVSTSQLYGGTFLNRALMSACAVTTTLRRWSRLSMIKRARCSASP